LDNSIFELERSFDFNSFKKWIKKLVPTEYIVPDVLEDCEETCQNVHKWFGVSFGLPLSPLMGKDCPSKSIGVVQGKTYEELVKCYKTIDHFCDKIAISFNYSFYEKSCPHKNQQYAWMYGRQHLLKKMLEDGVINKHKPHHLLGCSLPQEGLFYQNPKYAFIESVDSSNPVVHGIKGINYQNYGLDSKESQKLVELINCEVSEEQFRTVCKNIHQFNQFWNKI
jgi:hypothetical protein